MCEFAQTPSRNASLRGHESPMASDQPTDMSLELERGYDLHKAGRVDEASAVYAKIVALDPGNADALHLLGSIKAQRGEAAEGCRLIEAALKLKPDGALMWFNHGNALAVMARPAGRGGRELS